MSLAKNIIIWLLSVESRLILRKYKPFIVAVTGSVGKTTTKDAIFCVLSGRGGYVRKSEKSLNSEIGLPLTILGVPNVWHSPVGWLRNIFAGLKLVIFKKEYPDCLVLEIGADHPGDIKKVAKWLKPNMAVMTKVSKMPVHVEFFKSPEQVLEEKASLISAVKNGGFVIVYGDDDNVHIFRDKIVGQNISVIVYGMSESANLRGYVDSMNIDEGTKVIIQMDERMFTVQIKGVLSKTYIYPIMAAAAVGMARGMNGSMVVENLLKYLPPNGRMNIIPGINGSTIVDDSYNSSPDAVRSALETLNDIQCKGRRIAVLGDMMELGRYSTDEHRKMGAEAAEVLKKNGSLITVGQRSKVAAEEAIKNGMIAGTVHSFDHSEDLARFLIPFLSSGDVILVKGSQAMRMERVTRSIMLEPAKAADLLVRQEREWLEKA